MASWASILWLLRLCFIDPVKCSLLSYESYKTRKGDEKQPFEASGDNFKVLVKKNKRQPKGWRCIDNCCWIIGYLCTTWWLLLFLFHTFPVNFPRLKGPEIPGVRLKREGLTAKHPVVLVPGIISGGLELWEGKPCAEPLFRKHLWGGGFTQAFKRPFCWMEHLSLHYQTGLDPPGIRLRPVPGLAAADYFTPGYFVWAILIENLAKIGYEGKDMFMAAYDWRLSFQNTEIRDQSLSRLKGNIELMYVTNGNKKVVVLSHSMGALYFLHFVKWVESPKPMGGGGGPGWCAKHIKTIMNIGPTFLGVPKAFSTILSAESREIALIREMTSGLIDSEFLGLQTLEHVMRVSRTWDSIVSLVPKGGDTIWGNLDWSPEEGYECDHGKRTYLQHSSGENKSKSDGKTLIQLRHGTKHGRIISFGKEASKLHSSELPALSKEFTHAYTSTNSNASCGEVWTEYDEMSRESIRKIAENKVYTTTNLIHLLRYVAPKMMQRAEAHFSHGLAENLEDPKYEHHKYWSNPLETKYDRPVMPVYSVYSTSIISSYLN